MIYPRSQSINVESVSVYFMCPIESPGSFAVCYISTSRSNRLYSVIDAFKKDCDKYSLAALNFIDLLVSCEYHNVSLGSFWCAQIVKL